MYKPATSKITLVIKSAPLTARASPDINTILGFDLARCQNTSCHMRLLALCSVQTPLNLMSGGVLT